MDLEHELRRSLQRLGDGLDLPPAGVDAIVATARRRHRRRQAVGAAATAAVVAVTAIGVTRLGDDGDGGEFRSASGGADAIAPEVADPLQWSVLDPDGELGFARTVVGDDGTIYALSTAPGATWEDTTSLAQVLWRSADGAEWTAQEQGGALAISALDESGGVLYAVGTAPSSATVDGFEPVVATSSDGGATWAPSALPIDLAAPADGVVRTIGGSSIATGAAGTIAVVSTFDSLDPDAFDGSAEARTEGVGVWAPVTEPQQAACDAIAEDWGLLGGSGPTEATTAPMPSTTPPTAVATDPVLVDPDGGGAIERGLPGPGGIDYEDASITEREAGGEPIVVCQLPGDDQRRPYLAATRVGDVVPWEDLGIDPTFGARLAAGDTHTRQLVVDHDGVLTPVAAPFLDADGVEVLATDDGFLAVATEAPIDGPSSASVWRSADGETWEEVGVDPLGPNGWISAAGVVGDAVVLVSGADDPTVVTSTDGVDWSAVRLRDVLAAAPGDTVWVSGAAVGRAGVAVAIGVDRADGSGQSDFTLATSPDGTAWATQPLTDLVGAATSTGWMAVTDRVLVDVSVGGDPNVIGDEHHEVLQGR